MSKSTLTSMSLQNKYLKTSEKQKQFLIRKKLQDYIPEAIKDEQHNYLSLHTGHIVDTDGMENVEDFLKRRLNVGLNMLAIADHNTLATNKEANRLINNKNSEFYQKMVIIPSIELSIGGKFPGHIIFNDFILEEFDNIFYEKYLFDYLKTDFKNKNKLTSNLRKKLQNGELKTFQPSQIQENTDTAYIFEAICNMKRDPAYDNIIFPGDSLKEVFNKLLFHFKKKNLSKFPIIEITHPDSGKETNFLKDPINFFINRHLKYLHKKGLTNYGGILSTNLASLYLKNELILLQNHLKSVGEKMYVFYEIHNHHANGENYDKENSIKDGEDFVKLFDAIYTVGSDFHTNEKPFFGIPIPKGITLRDYINSEEFLKKGRKLEAIYPDNENNLKSLKDKFKNLVKNILFLHRWNIDPICNEMINIGNTNNLLFSNTDTNQDRNLSVEQALLPYNTINSLDESLLKKDISYKVRREIYKNTGKWKRAQKLQKRYAKFV